MIEGFKKDFKDKGTAYIKEGFHPLKKSQLNILNQACQNVKKEFVEIGDADEPNHLWVGRFMSDKDRPRLLNKGLAKNVIKILRFFKQGMAVIRSQSQYFLKAPHTFKLEYIKKTGGNQELHPYLNQFKECALNSCTVQYTPDGNYNTYSDGVMTSYSMQLGFNELEPIFNDDYSSLDGDSDSMIGY